MTPESNMAMADDQIPASVINKPPPLLDRLIGLSRNGLFWTVTIITLLAIFFCYTSQFAVLHYFPAGLARFLEQVSTPAYRILSFVSVGVTAWKFGVKAGLLTWLVLSSAILLKLISNWSLPDTWVDLATVALAALFAGLAGRQGEIERVLQKTTTELKRQSVVLKEEIAERKNSEANLRFETALLEAQSETTIDGILAVNENREIVLCNKRMQEMWHIPAHLLETRMYELVFRHILLQIRDTELSREQAESLLSDRIGKSRDEIQLADDRVFDAFTSPLIDAARTYRGRIWYFRDVTERKEMERRLIMTDRLASIGEFVSGIAHELNNPLTGIIGFSQLVMERDIDDDVREEITIISHEAQRAARIVKDLLTFARKHPPLKLPSRVNEIIEDVLRLRSYEHKVNNIEVIRNLDTNLPEIMTDYFQVQQVFLNLVINAEYFMINTHNKGQLTITTEKVNGMIRSTIADDGPGIAPENLKNIFDPFFTTKEVGKGTGLGLSICHGIITEHGGRIYANSELGKGSTFVVELPVILDNPAG